MKNKIVSIIAVFALLFGGMFMGTAPANAGTNNSVTHAADDSGFNDPIKVQCNDGTFRWLGLGVSSTDAGKCPTGSVARIYWDAGTQIQCFNYNGAQYIYGIWGGSGSAAVDSNLRLKCYNQLA